MEGLLTAEQLAAHIGVQRTSIYRMRTRGVLPEPAETIGRTPLWSVTTIDAWLRDRPSASWQRDKKRKPPAAGESEGG